MSLLRAVTTPITASIDKVLARAVTGRSEAARRRSRAESLGHEERIVALEKIRAAYPEGALDPEHGFFAAEPATEVTEREVGWKTKDGVPTRIVDLTWASERPLYLSDPTLRERYERSAANRRGVARLFLGEDRRDRPTAIVVHGYRAGQFAVEERVWPIGWLLRRGMNVALHVLPVHGLRNDRPVPAFPGSDPRFTNEGFRQAIFDLRVLKAHVEREGSPAVGAMGMSLGGYTVSLWATLDPLAFVAPIIPLASFADVARAAGRLVGSEQQQALQHAGLEEAHRIASPFTRASRVPSEAALVIAGEGDRITPLAHAERLRDHLGAELVTFAGGHIVQLGRREGFRALGRLLERRGLFTSRG
jgi:hypothetical protein